ncbi:MAG: ComEC/Rec2 family competence protein [Oscillospiraceae bacterium]
MGRTKKGYINKRRLTKWATLITAAVCLLLWGLDKAGVISYRELMVGLGLADKPATSADCSVHFIDVGQGDSTLVICDGEAMLIDAGETDQGDTVVSYLKAQNVTKLTYVIVTHQHSDHMGGMKDVLENFTVKKLIMPKMPDALVPTGAVYENLLTTIADKGLKITAATDTSFSLGSATVETFTAKGDYDDLNNYSVVTKITDGDNSFLITGDCEKPEEAELMNAGFDLSAKVIKVGHHGSSTSSGTDFLKAVSPRYAVISVGAGNSYGHPADTTVSNLNKFVSALYRTDLNGTVVFESDGAGLNVITEKG